MASNHEEGNLSSSQPSKYYAFEAELEKERKRVIKKRRRAALVENRQRDLPISSSDEGPPRKIRRKLRSRRRRVNSTEQQPDTTPVRRCRRVLRRRPQDRSFLRSKREDYVDSIVPKLFDYEFNDQFRVSRKTMSKLQECFLTSVKAENLVPKERRADVPLSDYMMMFLWFVGSNKSFKAVADNFDVALEDTIFVIKVVIKFFTIYEKKLIFFPQTRDEAFRYEYGFREVFQFPDTIGCLTTHYLKVREPHSRKGKLATVQTIFDAHGFILNLHVNSTKNVHPRDMLAESPIGQSLGDLCYNRYHVIADENHFVRKWLLTPFADAASSDEILFNTRHKAVMDGGLDAWKKLTSRFLQLTGKLLTTEYFSGIVTACCVLQNICVEEPSDFVFDEDYMDNVECPLRRQRNVSVEAVNVVEDIPDLRSSGLLKRRQTSHDML